MKEVDLYKGFEGEAELVMLSYDANGILITRLRLWYGTFSTIIERIKVNIKGLWEGVPLYYNTLTGWEDDGVWQCKDKELFVQQLEKIDLSGLDRLSLTSYQEVLRLFKDTIESGGKVFFVKE